VPEGDLKPPRSNADVQAYNRVAKEIMDANGIAVDDLYSFAEPRLADIQLPVNVHFTAAGYAKLAEAVAGSIEQALAQR
jgi:acyl-CoA thioesterase-1